MRIQLALLLFTFPLTSIGASYFNQNNTPQRAIGYGEGSFSIFGTVYKIQDNIDRRPITNSAGYDTGVMSAESYGYSGGAVTIDAKYNTLSNVSGGSSCYLYGTLYFSESDGEYDYSYGHLRWDVFGDVFYDPNLYIKVDKPCNQAILSDLPTVNIPLPSINKFYIWRGISGICANRSCSNGSYNHTRVLPRNGSMTALADVIACTSNTVNSSTCRSLFYNTVRGTDIPSGLIPDIPAVCNVNLPDLNFGTVGMNDWAGNMAQSIGSVSCTKDASITFTVVGGDSVKLGPFNTSIGINGKLGGSSIVNTGIGEVTFTIDGQLKSSTGSVTAGEYQTSVVVIGTIN
ncbi:hypothetical protein ACYJ2D_001713 [Providencia stuartii]